MGSTKEKSAQKYSRKVRNFKLDRKVKLFTTYRESPGKRKIKLSSEEEHIFIDILGEPSELELENEPLDFDEILIVLEIPGAATETITEKFSDIGDQLFSNAKTDMLVAEGGQKPSETGGMQSN